MVGFFYENYFQTKRTRQDYLNSILAKAFELEIWGQGRSFDVNPLNFMNIV